MATITDPAAIKFVNEQVRPLAELARAFRAKVNALMTDWYAGMNVVITNTPDLIDDGRKDEGVSQLTGADVTNCVGNLIAAHDTLNSEIIAKPCVKPLQVS